MLKLRFPVNIENPQATYQIPYGFIIRPGDGEEEPGGEWIDVGDSNYGLSLINNAKYSYDVDGNVLSLTVLRSPVYAHHIPRELDPSEDYKYIDQGEQEFTYLLYPHSGDWKSSDVVKLAESVNGPPVAFLEYNHAGFLPPSKSFMSIDKDNIIATVIKEAETGEGTIIRVYETQGAETEVNINLFDRSWKTTFSPCEIKSFLVPRDKNIPVKEVNLLEE